MALDPSKSQQELGIYTYNLNDVVGRGDFGYIYRGQEREHADRRVAIKIVDKKKLPASTDILVKEIQVWRELSSPETHSETVRSHPNLIALLSVHETPRYTCLVMEYCNGGDLADFLFTREYTLSADLIRIILKQLVSGITALKIKGVVHR